MSLHKQWLEADISQTLSYELSGKKILSHYLHGMRQLRDSIASQLVTYDIHAMVVGTVMLWIVSDSVHCPHTVCSEGSD